MFDVIEVLRRILIVSGPSNFDDSVCRGGRSLLLDPDFQSSICFEPLEVLEDRPTLFIFIQMKWWFLGANI